MTYLESSSFKMGSTFVASGSAIFSLNNILGLFLSLFSYYYITIYGVSVMYDNIEIDTKTSVYRHVYDYVKCNIYIRIDMQ